MPELQRLAPHHAASVLSFETENRAFFAASISDRGEEYFADFEARFQWLLSEQQEGSAAFFVLVGEGGEVLGRFNLHFVGDRTAELGYRVAQHVTGRGVATRTVLDLCLRAAEELGIDTIRAATSRSNTASQHVLLTAGFAEVGPAHPSEIGGRQGSWYERHLAAGQSWEPSR
jgi:ribosomal-protein-alanine N-acetyltransferase